MHYALTAIMAILLISVVALSVQAFLRVSALDESPTRQEVASVAMSLAWLAGLAAVAPFVGLVGTVWHMMAALTGLGAQSDLVSLAQPLGRALAYTFYGIVAAIPAVLAYTVLSRKLDLILDQAEADQ